MKIQTHIMKFGKIKKNKKSAKISQSEVTRVSFGFVRVSEALSGAPCIRRSEAGDKDSGDRTGSSGNGFTTTGAGGPSSRSVRVYGAG